MDCRSRAPHYLVSRVQSSFQFPPLAGTRDTGGGAGVDGVQRAARSQRRPTKPKAKCIGRRPRGARSPQKGKSQRVTSAASRESVDALAREFGRLWIPGSNFGHAALAALWVVSAVAGCGNDGPASAGSGGTSAGGEAGIGGDAGSSGSAGSAAASGAGGAAGAAGMAGQGGAGGKSPWDEGCKKCHGSDVNPAPPFDLDGNDDTSFPGVGAHQSHLAASPWRGAMGCNECHIVPLVPTWDPSTPSHMNGVNDLDWGPLAQSGEYDPTNRTCANTYCHGGTLGPDAPGLVFNRKPNWTIVDGSQASCGTCHTLPPGGSHPLVFDCAACHANSVASITPGDPPSVSWENPSFHIDGKVDMGGIGCSICHGDPATGDIAPPRGTQGETETSQPAVGAHQIHLADSPWRRKGQCTDCHSVPGTIGHPTGTVEHSWGGPSAVGSADPSYSASTNACSNVYCHGATLREPISGGTVNRTPIWTTVDGTYSSCGTTCHTLPPGGTHPTLTSCELCHGSTISAIDLANPQGATWNDPSLHINGEVNF